MILVIDNYDSFVHNLARYVRLAGEPTQLVRNDAIDAEAIEQLDPLAIVLSPGPGAPSEAGCCIDVVRSFRGRTPIFGVCLGHQAIVEAYGGQVIRAPQPIHGDATMISHRERDLFAGVPTPLEVCRYHSLVAHRDELPAELEVDAMTEEGLVMALHAVHEPVYGVQFHPEAILTQQGQAIVNNFVRLARRWRARCSPAGVGD